MQKEVDPEKFRIFRYKGDDEVFVAVPNQYTKLIDAAIEQYGSISAVPNMKTVRGIFARRVGKSYRYADRNMQENDVTISQLLPIAG
jgi:hypothetical protein